MTFVLYDDTYNDDPATGSSWEFEDFTSLADFLEQELHFHKNFEYHIWCRP